MGHHTPQHGKLGIIDPEAGRDENEGVMFVAPVHKPEPERIDGYGKFTDQFQHPFPLSETDFLISYSVGLLRRTSDGIWRLLDECGRRT